MGEILFYHLTETPLEQAAPEILEKCLARGWRVTMRFGSAERMEAFDRRLWTYRDDAFLPHGTPADGRGERQPVYLTTGEEKPNAPEVLMLADGAAARAEELAGHERGVLLFDGHDPGAVEAARAAWREVGAAGLKAIYWAQEDGRWIRRAESGG